MKKLFLSLLILVSIFTITGCGKKIEVSEDAKRFKEEYESLNGQVNDMGKEYRTVDIVTPNRVIYSSAKEIVEKIENKESFVVYFGFSKCPWCRSVISTLLNISNDMEVDIYYVDVLDIRDTLKYENGEIVTVKEGDSNYMKLLEYFKDVLSDYNLSNEIEAPEKRIYAPNIISVVEGEAVNLETGISALQTDGNMELTEEILADQAKAFEDLLNEYLDEVSMCDVNSQTKC